MINYLLRILGGKPYEKKDERKARKKAKVEIDDAPKFEVMHSTRNKHGGPVPVKVTVDDFDPYDGNDAVDLYSSTISGLRRKNKEPRKPRHSDDDEEPNSPPPVEAKQALISENKYVDDDWLEDDMGGPGKRNKRKRNNLAVDSDEGEGDRYEFSRLRPNNRPSTVTVDSEESDRYESSRIRHNNRPSSSSCSDLPSASTSHRPTIVLEDSDEDEIQEVEVTPFPALISRPLSFSDLSTRLTETRESKSKKKGKPIQTKLPFKPVSKFFVSCRTCPWTYNNRNKCNKLVFGIFIEALQLIPFRWRKQLGLHEFTADRNTTIKCS